MDLGELAPLGEVSVEGGERGESTPPQEKGRYEKHYRWDDSFRGESGSLLA